MRKFCVASLLLLAPLFAFAQTAEEMDELLALSGVTYAQASRFVLVASGIQGEETTPDEAFAYARGQKWLPASAAAAQPITLGGLSLLMMKSFRLRGGFMYAFFPSGRYAYRSMVRQGYIQGFADPALRVSGERFFLILGKMLAAQGGEA